MNSFKNRFWIAAACAAVISCIAFAINTPKASAGTDTLRTVVYLTSGTSWTVPAAWNSSNNTIEVIGGGAGAGSSNVAGGGGGGGGAYSKISNLSLTPGGSVTYQVGAAGAAGVGTFGNGGNGGDTYFNGTGSTCASQSVCAKGGSPGTGGSGGAGGLASGSVGTTKYDGGTGASPGWGAGAAGPNGAGLTSGVGDNGSGGGRGSFPGGTGGAGTEWDATHGSGGGGSDSALGIGGTGGNYGGGGGGGGADGGPGGGGAQGIIVIIYYRNGINLTKNSTVTGNASVLGTLSKGSGTFVIDHPLDPKNKLLYHSFVESPDAMNIYDGIATLDNKGEAVIELPMYFLALNKDFTYLGTPLGQPMPNLHLSKDVRKKFIFFGAPVLKIAGGAPNGRVSWQVTGVRKDPYILMNPIKTERDKGAGEIVNQGEYICPECYAQ